MLEELRRDDLAVLVRVGALQPRAQVALVDRPVPVHVQVAEDGLDYPQDIGLSLVTWVSAGDGHSAALDQAGNVFVWGDLTSRYAPDATPDLEGALRVESGSNFVLAVLDDGRVKGIGDNTYGQLTHDPTDGTYALSFVTLPGLAGVDLVLSGGGDHALAFEE